MGAAPSRGWRRARLGLATALLALLGAAAGVPGASEVPSLQPSRLAPLARQSLLLAAARAGERLVAVGERGHVLLSDDEGGEWRQVALPVRATLTGVHFPTPRVGWAVGHDAVIVHSADAGESWQLQYAAPELEIPLLDVWFADARRGFAVGAYGLFLETSDAGASWQQRQIADSDRHFNSIAAVGDGRIFLAGESGSVWRSADGGESWEPLPSPSGGSIFDIVLLPDGGLLAAGLRGGLHRFDGGESWQQIESGTSSSLMAVAAGGDGRVLAAGVSGVLLASRDGGRHFARLQRPDRKTVAAVLARRDAGFVVLGDFGAELFDPARPPASEDPR